MLALPLFCGCGGAPPPIPPPPSNAALRGSPRFHESPDADGKQRRPRERTPTAAERAIVRDLMTRAERLRRLRFREPVPVVVQNQDAVIAYIEEELNSSTFERAKTIYMALGMVSAELNVERELTETLAEQVVGYYDARRRQLVVRDDVFAGLLSAQRSREANGAREVLLHELIHALQDQHLGLQPLLNMAAHSDRLNAYRALVEGDATLATAGFSAQMQGKDLRTLVTDPAGLRGLSAAIRKAAVASPRLSKAPAILREPLLFAYCDGLQYVAHLWAAHNSFAGINAAHRAPPLTTEQILHPLRPARLSEALELKPNPALLAAHYELIAEDTLGELELGIFLQQANANDAARSAADGWDGDRVQVYRHRSGTTAALWLTRWDDVVDAREMAHAAERVLRAPVEQFGSLTSGLKATQRYVVIVRGVPATLVEPSLRAALSGQLDRPAAAN